MAGFKDFFQPTGWQWMKASATLILLNNVILGISPSHSLAFAGQLETSLEVNVLPQPVKAKRPFAYSVEMADPQYLQPRTAKGEESLLSRLVNSKVVLFGKHSASSPSQIEKDLNLQISLLDRMLGANPNRKIIIASQALPQSPRIDQALRRFIASKTPDETREKQATVEAQLFEEIEDSLSPNEERRYLAEIRSQMPLFRWARDHSFPVVSLDLPWDVQSSLRKGGLSQLSEETRSQYLIDPKGFVAAVTNPAYQTYVDDILKQQFVREVESSSSSPTDTVDGDFQNFVSSKMFQHEAIATRIIAALLSPSPIAQSIDNKSLLKSIPESSLNAVVSFEDNQLPLVIASVHQEDSVFHYGIEERIKRLKALLSDPSSYQKKYFYEKINELLAAREAAERKGPQTIDIKSDIRMTGKVDLKEDVYSMLLNPTAEDSFSRIAGLRLGLAFDDDFVNDRTLSDFVWFSDYPPIKLLTRPQNPISREGDKPEGETSILGVF